jgi:antitoxin component YwqK of YwqJK toxin-antitoxin module
MRKPLHFCCFTLAIILFCSRPGMAGEPDSTFKDWYYTPTGVFGRLPLAKTRYRTYVKISRMSKDLVVIEKHNPADILINTTQVRFANGRISLMTETGEWGEPYDSTWFKPDGDNDFIVTERIRGVNPFLPCRSERLTFKNGQVHEVLCLVDSTKPGTNKEGVAHYVIERYDDPARFGLIKTEIYYNEIDMPVISRRRDCHKLVNDYDKNGNLVSLSLYGPDDKSMLNREGFFKAKYGYDGDDNETEVKYYDLKGSLTTTIMGYSQLVRKYRKGFVEKEIYYGENDKVVRSSRLADSVAGIEYKRDDNGRELEKTYFDQDWEEIENTKGAHRTAFSYSSTGMLVSVQNFPLDPRKVPSVTYLTNVAGYRYEHDGQGRLIGMTFLNNVGTPAKVDGIDITKYKYDAWGRCISTSFWLDDSTTMVSTDGYYEEVFHYDDDGQLVEADYLDQLGHPTTGYIGYSRQLVSYNEQGLVAEREYFDGSTPVLVEDRGAFATHFHAIRYDYDYYDRVTRISYYNLGNLPTSAIANLKKETVNCQRIEFVYEGGRLLGQRIRDSGNVSTEVTLDCAKGDCLPAIGFGRRGKRLLGFNNSRIMANIYHGKIHTDSVFYGEQLSFIDDNDVLLFLNAGASKLSRKECAVLYRVTRLNKFYQLDGPVTDYYMTNDSVAARLSYNSGALGGQCSFYYVNGKLKEEGVYVKGVRVGTWDYFYENGKKEKTIDFTDKGPRLMECYAEDGRVLTRDGNGRFEGLVTLGTNQSPMDYRITGNIKDGQPDGEWKIYNKYLTGPANIEKFSSGRFKHGTSYFKTGSREYYEGFYSRFESLHTYELLDHYGQQTICLVSGDHLVSINDPVPVTTALYPRLREGIVKIMQTNKYQDYTGWIFLDLKYNETGQIIKKDVRMFVRNDAFKTEILDMLDNMRLDVDAYKGTKITFDKFFVALVEANDVVLPEELLMRQRGMIFK